MTKEMFRPTVPRITAPLFAVLYVSLLCSPIYAADPPAADARCGTQGPEACYADAMRARDEGSSEKAKSLFRDACEQGHNYSCFRLGALELTSGNKDEGRRLLAAACAKQAAAACARLAALAEDGNNGDEARRYYHSACNIDPASGKTERGIAAMSCFRLRDIERRMGHETRANAAFSKGRELLQANCKDGDRMSCNALSAEEFAENRRLSGS